MRRAVLPGRNPNLYLAECPAAHARSPRVRNRLIYKDSFEEGPLSRVAAEQFSTVVSRWTSEEEACVEELTSKTSYNIIL